MVKFGNSEVVYSGVFLVDAIGGLPEITVPLGDRNVIIHWGAGVGTQGDDYLFGLKAEDMALEANGQPILRAGGVNDLSFLATVEQLIGGKRVTFTAFKRAA